MITVYKLERNADQLAGDCSPLQKYGLDSGQNKIKNKNWSKTQGQG